MAGVDLGIPGIGPADEVARGGFSTVFRAYQTSFEREVAVKLLSGVGYTDEDKQRFLSECRALGRVSDHPAIVSVYEAGINGRGQPYVVMQYVTGGSLEDRLGRGALAADEVVRIGQSLASAVGAAHAVGVLHLDVKPANVLVDRYGNHLLTDFGIARLVDAPRTLTHQTIAGTPGFIAPELLDGQRATERADIYEIGATLYALAAGRPPYGARPGEGIWQFLVRMGREAPDPLPPGIPPELTRVIARAMAREPDARFATCAELGEALASSGELDRTFVRPAVPPGSGTPLRVPPAPPLAAPSSPPGPLPAAPPQPPYSAPPPPPPSTQPGPVTVRPARRRRTGAIVAGIGAVAVVAVAAVFALGGGDDPSDGGRDRAAGQQVTETTGPDGTVSSTVAASAPGTTVPPTVAQTVASGSTAPAPTAAPTTAGPTVPPTLPPTGPFAALAVSSPRGIAVGPDGSLVVVDAGHHRVLSVTPAGAVSVVAGTGVAGFSGDGGPATVAALDEPEGVAVGPDGSIVIGDRGNDRIRRIGPDGIIETIAGSGTGGVSGDGGPAVEAALDDPTHVAITPSGTVVFTETGGHRVRQIVDGIIETIAGSGTAGSSGAPGPATAAALNQPQGVVALADGSVVFSDTRNHQVKKVFPDGTLVVLAGTGAPGYSGDGGLATAAALALPVGVAATLDGSVVVADSGNSVVRRISPDGVITTVAGTGVAGYSGDWEAATSAELDAPEALTALLDGTVVISDTRNDVVRAVSADGTIGELGVPEPAPAPTYLTGVVVRTCGLDGNGDCFLGVHPEPNIDVLSYTLDEGTAVTIVCQLRGQSLRSTILDARSDVWLRLSDGSYVSALFIDSPDLSPFSITHPC